MQLHLLSKKTANTIAFVFSGIFALNTTFLVNSLLSTHLGYIQSKVLLMIALLLLTTILINAIVSSKFENFEEHNEKSILKSVVKMFVLALLMNGFSELIFSVLIIHLLSAVIGYHFFSRYGSLQGKTIFKCSIIVIILESFVYFVASLI